MVIFLLMRWCKEREDFSLLPFMCNYCATPKRECISHVMTLPGTFGGSRLWVFASQLKINQIRSPCFVLRLCVFGLNVNIMGFRKPGPYYKGLGWSTRWF